MTPVTCQWVWSNPDTEGTISVSLPVTTINTRTTYGLALQFHSHLAAPNPFLNDIDLWSAPCLPFLPLIFRDSLASKPFVVFHCYIGSWSPRFCPVTSSSSFVSWELLAAVSISRAPGSIQSRTCSDRWNDPARQNWTPTSQRCHASTILGSKDGDISCYCIPRRKITH